MLETIREYALEQLAASGEAEAIHRAHAEYCGMQIERVVNGEIVEHWRKSDDLGLLQQLGAIPAPQLA